MLGSTTLLRPLAITAIVLCLSPTVFAQVTLLQEDFDDVSLTQVTTFETEVRGRQVWTSFDRDSDVGGSLASELSSSATWSVDNSAMPAATTTGPDSNLIGVAEFEGWSFVDKSWWVNTAGDQNRSEFLNASGTIAVADPDEWDDFSGGNNPSPTSFGDFDSTLRVNDIVIPGSVSPNSLNIFFHSSWQPEGVQKAELVANYNDPGSTSLTLFTWDSDTDSPNYHADGFFQGVANPTPGLNVENETVSLPLLNPAGATELDLAFRLYDAGNNWWWAIDNLSVFTGAAPAADGVLRASINRDTQQVTITNNTGSPVQLNGYSLESLSGAFDGTVATFLADSDSTWQVLDGEPGTGSLSEGNYDFDTLAGGATINLGAAWVKYFEDDVVFEYLVEGQQDPIQGIVEFAGNEDSPFLFLDLNFDGDIDLLDYQAFLDGYGSDLSAASAAQAYGLGDLNADGKHSVQDFLDFKKSFDNLRGPGAFAAMLSSLSVPEPSSLLLVLLAGLTVAGKRQTRRVALILLEMALFSTTPAAHAQIPLLIENFDDVPLGTSPEENPAQDAVWSEDGPAGWLIDDSGMPFQPRPVEAQNGDGVEDWNGWAFVDKAFWLATADQGRSAFDLGSGVIMVADPDEWEDDSTSAPGRDADFDNNNLINGNDFLIFQRNFGTEMGATNATGDANQDGAVTAADFSTFQSQYGNSPPNDVANDFYDALALTPSLSIPSNIPSGRVKLSFDSSWRPEGMDDGAVNDLNNQTGIIRAIYNRGQANERIVEVLHWDSDPESDFFKPGNENESIQDMDLDFQSNGSEQTLHLEMFLGQAWNDWWWAIDNLSVLIPADPSILRIDLSDGTAQLVGGDVVNASINGIDIISPEGNLTGIANAGLHAIAGLDAIDGPDADSTVGNSINETWQLATASAQQFSEFFLDGQSDFTTARTEDLGQIIDPAKLAALATSQDIEFTYSNVFGQSIVGVVEYVGTLSAITAVPEPSSLLLVCSLMVGQGAIRNRKRESTAAASKLVLLLLIAVSVNTTTATAQVVPPPFVDRLYSFGEDGAEGASPGAFIGASNSFYTNDSAGQAGQGQLIDLQVLSRGGGGPTYVQITDRPDGVSGLAANLNNNGNPSAKHFLATLPGEALNFPEFSPSSTEGLLTQGTIDYQFITDRGFQVWVKPAALPSTGDAHIVMDSNNHGVLIDGETGTFGMRYSGFDYAAGETTSSTDEAPITVLADDWYHLMVVRPNPGQTNSVLYVNGIAQAAATGGYKGEDVPNDEVQVENQEFSALTVGANTASTSVQMGQNSYFSGIVDDLEIFVMGLNNSTDFGEFELTRDNDYVALMAPSVEGDITGPGGTPDGVVNMLDVTTFADNWLSSKTLTWTQGVGVAATERSLTIGDLSTRSRGDFNFDGRVDLGDWRVLNNANPAMAQAALALIQSVPEPSSLSLCLAAFALLAGRRKRG